MIVCTIIILIAVVGSKIYINKYGMYYYNESSKQVWITKKNR